MFDDRIVPTRPYGEHIVLTCRNHPDLRWTTKNIAPLGCRSLFYWGNKEQHETHDFVREPECPCSIRDLVLSPEYDAELEEAYLAAQNGVDVHSVPAE